MRQSGHSGQVVRIVFFDPVEGIPVCSKDPLSPGSQLAAAALKGEPQACYRLACLCLEGALPPYGRDLALPLLERAAARGHAGAKKKLSELTATLRRMDADQEGSSHSLHELMHRGGEDEAAAQRLSSLRPGGDAQSASRLELTADRYRSAAENGDATAQFALAHCFRLGMGVAPDAEACAYWFRQSAEQGLADGQCNTGWCYGTGYGVPLSYASAMHWYSLAEAQGHDLARRNNLTVRHIFARDLASSAISLADEGLAIAPDHTIEVNRRKCCIYISKQYASYLDDDGTTSYRFHLCDCHTIRDMAARGRKYRYIATARDDGLFAVTPLRGRQQDTETAREIPMQLCQHCRQLLQAQGIYEEPFSLRAFYAKHQPQLPDWEELEQYLVEPA